MKNNLNFVLKYWGLMMSYRIQEQLSMEQLSMGNISTTWNISTTGTIKRTSNIHMEPRQNEVCNHKVSSNRVLPYTWNNKIHFDTFQKSNITIIMKYLTNHRFGINVMKDYSVENWTEIHIVKPIHTTEGEQLPHFNIKFYNKNTDVLSSTKHIYIQITPRENGTPKCEFVRMTTLETDIQAQQKRQAFKIIEKNKRLEELKAEQEKLKMRLLEIQNEINSIIDE